MTNTDFKLSFDDSLDQEQYKKWTAIRTLKQEKEGMHKKPHLLKKQERKKKTIRFKDKEFLDEVFVIPSSEYSMNVTNLSLHPEVLKTVPSYNPGKKISWWDWLTGNDTPYENDVDIPNVLKEVPN